MPHRLWTHACALLGESLLKGSFEKIAPVCWRCHKPYDYAGWGLSGIEGRGNQVPAHRVGVSLALGNCNLQDGIQDRDASAIRRAREFFELVLREAPDSDLAAQARDGLARLAALEAGTYDELYPPALPTPQLKAFGLGAISQRKLHLEIAEDGSLLIPPLEGDEGRVIAIKHKDAVDLLSRVVRLLEETPNEGDLATGPIDILPPWFGGSREHAMNRLKRVVEALRGANHDRS